MAQSDVERLAVLIEANTKQYERAMKRVEKRTNTAMRRSAKQTQTMATAMRNATVVARNMVAAMGVGIGVTQLPRTIRQTVNEVSELGKVADTVGFTTDELQELRFAAEKAGIASRQLDTGLQRFSRRVAEARQGSGELQETLEQYGITLTDNQGRMRTNNQILRDFADAVASAESRQEALRIAYKGFDSEAARLVTVLRDGSRGMREAAEEANNLDVVIDGQLVRTAEELDDKFTELTATIRTQFQVAVLESADAINSRWEQAGRIMSSALDDIGGSAEAASGHLETLLFWLQRIGPQGIPQVLSDLAGAGMDALDPQSELERQLQERGPAHLRRARRMAGREGGGGSVAPPSEEEEEAQKEAEKAQKRIDKTIEKLRFEEEQIKRTNVEQKVYNQLKQAGVSRSSEYGQEIEGLVRRTHELEQAQAQAEEQQRRTNMAMQNLAASGGRAIGRLISGTSDWRQELINLIPVLLRVMNTMGALGPNGDILTSLVGGIFGGFRASGGPVESNRAYMVGERGPEMFVPNGSGNIVPSGSGGASIHMPVSISAPGADPAQLRRLEERVEALRRSAPDIAVAAVKNARSRRAL